MIGQVRGIILDKLAPQLTLDVHGVGYEIDAPMSTFYQLPDIGHEVRLYTHFVVREDAQHLYGFYTQDERQLFRTLLKVNGVGPRLALTVLSSTSPNEFVRCVLNNDTESLVKLPGIGKKTAERLVIEMRDKLGTLHQPDPADYSVHYVADPKAQTIRDAMSALINLGYNQLTAQKAIKKTLNDLPDGSDLPTLITSALKNI